MPSVRTSHKHQSYDRSLSVYGHFLPNAGNAIATKKSTGGTFLRTGGGVITFTFSEPVKLTGYWQPMVQLHMGIPNGSYAVVTNVTQAATGIITVTIGTFNAAHAAADIGSHATNVVSFDMKVQIVGP